MNDLIDEKSPYLLQHAHNPVEWRPWCDEAFRIAAERNRPVFLSIGYATCHWCHVMEKETFEDPEAAKYLNQTFVCIKVDREERPDIDSVYMAACQLLHGSGGWPLTVLMTPDKKPFFAATYLPRTGRFGQTGVIELCRRVETLWHSEKDKLQATAQQVDRHLGRLFEFSAAGELDESVLKDAFARIEQSYDSRWGGFEPAPKFPTPHRMLFLLSHFEHFGDVRSLDMVKETLRAMRLGGIWDHVGFGFHRYATDRQWLLPHFEKMLYDQALLSMAYLQTYRITGEKFFAATAEKIFTYVLRDMQSDAGAFYSAEDADSEGEEGKFYVWTMEELDRVLSPKELRLCRQLFNLRPAGNFLEESTGRATGSNILHLEKPLSRWAGDLKMPQNELASLWESARVKLFRAREQRVHPLKDDKILVDWNGLMIAALASGAVILDRNEYALAAGKAASFILDNLQDKQKTLLHRYREGQSAVRAFADDYAFLIWGLIDLYRATADPSFLSRANDLQHQMDRFFSDTKNGGYYMTMKGATDLPLRPKEIYDGAIPSANAVALHNLIHLSELTGDSKWRRGAGDLIRAFAGTVKNQPSAHTFFLAGVDRWLRGKKQFRQH